jgi:viologen exporter family transport system permease protein
MRFHARLIRAFFQNCLAREMMFRASFVMSLLSGYGWSLIMLLFLTTVVARVQRIGNWEQRDIYVLVGTFMIVQSVTQFLFESNMWRISSYVREGTLDFILTKPVDSQFFTSLRYLRLPSLGLLLPGVALVATGARAPFVLSDLLLYLASVLGGLAILYSISFMLATTTIWLVRAEMGGLVYGMFDVMRLPADVYPRVVRFTLTYVLPLVFIASVPAQTLQHRGHAVWALAGTGIGLAMLAVSRALWRFALRSYSSTGS